MKGNRKARNAFCMLLVFLIAIGSLSSCVEKQKLKKATIQKLNDVHSSMYVVSLN